MNSSPEGHTSLGALYIHTYKHTYIHKHTKKKSVQLTRRTHFLGRVVLGNSAYAVLFGRIHASVRRPAYST